MSLKYKRLSTQGDDILDGYQSSAREKGHLINGGKTILLHLAAELLTGAVAPGWIMLFNDADGTVANGTRPDLAPIPIAKGQRVQVDWTLAAPIFPLGCTVQFSTTEDTLTAPAGNEATFDAAFLPGV